VGKTTLVNKLLIKQKQRTTVKKYNNANGQNVSTDGFRRCLIYSNMLLGIDIEDFTITVDFPEKEGKEKVKKQKVNLNVWDFAGQGLKPYSHFFLTFRNLLCFSPIFPKSKVHLRSSL
jgi:GTPase SAR1 family protein